MVYIVGDRVWWNQEGDMVWWYILLVVTGSGGIMREIGDQGDIMMDGLSDGMTHSTPGSLATLRNCTLGMWECPGVR